MRFLGKIIKALWNFTGHPLIAAGVLGIFGLGTIYIYFKGIYFFLESARLKAVAFLELPYVFPLWLVVLITLPYLIFACMCVQHLFFENEEKPAVRAATIPTKLANFTSQFFDNIKWHWRWISPDSFLNLTPMCPTCEIDLRNEKVNKKLPTRSLYESIRFTEVNRYICDICKFKIDDPDLRRISAIIKKSAADLMN